MKKLARWKPDPATIQMRFVWIGCGVGLYSAFTDDCRVPLGSVWCEPASNAFGEVLCDVLDIYVPEKYRRKGIASHMLKFLLTNYGILRTGTGTKSSGLPLLKSMGWKQNRQTGDWYLRGDIKHLK